MPKNKNISTGQAIRRIRAGEIAPVYTLCGGDPFLEDYFISELKTSFLMEAGSKLHFSLDQDSPELLFGELSSISLFEEKRIIIVREIKKLRADGGRKELIQYIEFPPDNTVLVLIQANSAQFGVKLPAKSVFLPKTFGSPVYRLERFLNIFLDE